MTCTCISYNQPRPEQVTPERRLGQWEYFPDTARDIVMVDECIADVIIRLWAAGIRTGGSCCGHNGPPPSVFLIHAEDAVKAKEVLALDDRAWHVLFWAGPRT